MSGKELPNSRLEAQEEMETLGRTCLGFRVELVKQARSVLSYLNEGKE